jgi:DNA modification methylase
LGRGFVGFELDDGYFKAAEKRLGIDKYVVTAVE